MIILYVHSFAVISLSVLQDDFQPEKQYNWIVSGHWEQQEQNLGLDGPVLQP